jgi:hypothetical protein
MLHCTLRNELQEKLRAAEIDHGRSIKEILAMCNMVALRLIFEYSKASIFREYRVKVCKNLNRRNHLNLTFGFLKQFKV